MTDATFALSESTARTLFRTVRDGFELSGAPGWDGFFDARFEYDVSLQGGRFDFTNNGTVSIRELDVVYDRARLVIGIDLPRRVLIGRRCFSFLGRRFCTPEVAVFEGNPDFGITLDLLEYIRSEISGEFRIERRYVVDDERPAGMSDHDALDLGLENKWQYYLTPNGNIDVEILDFPDIVGDILEIEILDRFDAFISILPDRLQDLARGLLGNVVDFVRAVLDINDDLQEWLQTTIDGRIGFVNKLSFALAKYLTEQAPIFAFQDPMPLMPAGNGLMPVLVPIEDPRVDINRSEMIISASLGA